MIHKLNASVRPMLFASAVLLAGSAAVAMPTTSGAPAVAPVPPPVVGLAGPWAVAALDADTAGPPRDHLISEHVVVISVDGLRPDAIERFGAGTLLRMMSEGSYSLEASTIMPSRTLPSHTSMLTGAAPDAHGVTWNTNAADEHGHAAVPTIFARARDEGFRTAAFFGKGKFHHLNVPNTLDHVQVPEGNDRWSADRVLAGVEAHLAGARPNLVFVHLTEPDAAGHTFSWMSWFYGRAVRKADAAVAQVLEAADGAFGEGAYTVIVTADHGGHGWTHGSSDPRDVTIPWIAWGKGVRAGSVLDDGIRTMDTAATALWLLGVSGSGVGEPVRAAFEREEPELRGIEADSLESVAR